MGTGQRRPSRSPRSQRSRSADVDCLKKYTERRVEERRHTEIADTSKLDPSRWIPLPKSIGRGQPPTARKPSQALRCDDKRRTESIEEESEPGKTSSAPAKKASPTKEEQTKPEEKSEPRSVAKAAASRSHSTDVGHATNEKLVEDRRRHTECGDSRAIGTRWIPQINTSRFRYDASPFARFGNTCDITKYAAARWMTLVKNPSPSRISRLNPDRKSSAIDDAPCKLEAAQANEVKKDTPKWEPLRKFSPVTANEKEAGQKQEVSRRTSGDAAECKRDSLATKKSPDSSDHSTKLSQRMRDLYDFKTENEWPKRAMNPRREHLWISKSSSEEEKHIQPVRRNSQDLEFNDRIRQIKLKDTKVQSVHDDQKPEKDGSEASDTLSEGYQARLKKFNERLRFSEDLGEAKPRRQQRRTYSDDYDEKARRASRSVAKETTDSHVGEKKRLSDASSKSRGSYAEVNPVKRDPRTSDASYVSIGQPSAKRGSVECSSSRQMFAIPPRRAFSQTEERPSTPVPPIEWNDERFVGMKLPSERQKRDSTRYKVYLT